MLNNVDAVTKLYVVSATISILAASFHSFLSRAIYLSFEQRRCTHRQLKRFDCQFKFQPAQLQSSSATVLIGRDVDAACCFLKLAQLQIQTDKVGIGINHGKPTAILLVPF